MYNCTHVFVCFIFIFIVKAVYTVNELDNGFGKTETSLAAKKYVNLERASLIYLKSKNYSSEESSKHGKTNQNKIFLGF